MLLELLFIILKCNVISLSLYHVIQVKLLEDDDNPVISKAAKTAYQVITWRP